MTAVLSRPVAAPASAWLDGVNPATKILLALVLSVPLLASIDVVSALVAIGLQLLCVPLTGLGYRTVLLRLLPLAALAPIAGISMLLYAEPGGTVYWSFGVAAVSDASIAFAVAVAVRVFALALPTILLFGRTDPNDLAAALAQIVRLPSRFVLGVLAGTRTLGLFVDDWRAMGLARRARGVGDRGALRRFFSMAFVLLVFAVRRGTKLATAMEARGFGAPMTRTWLRRSTLGRRDALALAGGVLLIAAALTVAVAAGTFRFVWS
ncbi:energy-coupling factor transporter transmembrane component T family protein [Microbacterium telephonicum]|uniref:Energy-coupling factor transport system permease protein n=1 Tax=Microbacterium telephonicum TaxID=1714841 RepID=A0A498C2K4_9MICO|nr:energy-coupling factor transporter transmembrane component T [Microbacterium telephonicum]RLK46671.1 energy-coupling factor transport system permease protein [Microbacterium telephonicum]